MEYDQKTENIIHLLSNLLPDEEDYVRERYLEGLRTGILQVITAIEIGDIDKLIKKTGTMSRNKSVPKDPIELGKVNGNKIGYSIFLDTHDPIGEPGW